jgi:hypothetical protein
MAMFLQEVAYLEQNVSGDNFVEAVVDQTHSNNVEDPLQGFHAQNVQ